MQWGSITAVDRNIKINFNISGYTCSPTVFLTPIRDADWESAGYMGITTGSVTLTSFNASYGEYESHTGHRGFNWIAIGY